MSLACSLAQAHVSHHFLEALLAMRPPKDSAVSWELLARLALVAHHPAIAAGLAGGRAWHRIKRRLSTSVADVVAGAALYELLSRVQGYISAHRSLLWLVKLWKVPPEQLQEQPGHPRPVQFTRCCPVCLPRTQSNDSVERMQRIRWSWCFSSWVRQAHRAHYHSSGQRLLLRWEASWQMLPTFSTAASWSSWSRCSTARRTTRCAIAVSAQRVSLL